MNTHSAEYDECPAFLCLQAKALPLRRKSLRTETKAMAVISFARLRPCQSAARQRPPVHVLRGCSLSESGSSFCFLFARSICTTVFSSRSSWSAWVRSSFASFQASTPGGCTL
jgi:hypothetical protein